MQITITMFQLFVVGLAGFVASVIAFYVLRPIYNTKNDFWAWRSWFLT